MGSVLISTRRLLPVCWADFSPVLGPAVGDRQALEVLLPSHLGPWGPKDLGDVRFSQPSPALDFSVFFFCTWLLHWMRACQRPQVSGG